MKPKGSNRKAMEAKKRIINLLNERGYTREEIASEVGLHHTTVTYHLNAEVRLAKHLRYHKEYVRQQKGVSIKKMINISLLTGLPCKALQFKKSV